MFKWIKGRQQGSYEKLPLLISTFFNFDSYILRFPAGCSVIQHRDPAEKGYEHHRINILLKKSPDPEDCMYIHGPIWRWWRIEFFRPDLYEHGLRPIKGKMYMLSIGWRSKKAV